MPAGTPKVALFGGKAIVPGGTQTFNSPGTFTVPVGVSRINITGRGGSGNPGNSSNAGNPGSGGVGGVGGTGVNVRPYCPCNGQGGTQSQSGGSAGYLQCGFSPAGANGNPGSAGNPGNAGTASTGFCLTFPGGAAGNGAAAGSGGSKGNVGASGGTLTTYWSSPCGWQSYSTQPGGAGGNGGGPGTTAAPCYSPLWTFGWGGGGAGVCNNGSTRTDMTSPWRCGGSGGNPGGGGGGGFPACSGQTPCFRPNSTGRKANADRAGSGGGAGAGAGYYGPGGGGGGRGAVGNPGNPGNAGSAANPSTTNCRAVTPGASYPISVGSPGGQVVVSWNPQ